MSELLNTLAVLTEDRPGATRLRALDELAALVRRTEALETEVAAWRARAEWVRDSCAPRLNERTGLYTARLVVVGAGDTAHAATLDVARQLKLIPEAK